MVEAVKECEPGLQRIFLAKMLMVAQAYGTEDKFELTPDLAPGFL